MVVENGFVDSSVLMQTEIEESRSACDDGLTCAMLSLQQEVVLHLSNFAVLNMRSRV